jgi:hypothetical protein
MATQASPPKPWESTEADAGPDAPVEDPVKLLGSMLLGKGGPATGNISTHEIRVSSALVLGGVCLGLAGFAAITLSLTQGGDPYPVRRLGGVLGGVGLLMLMWGILAGLPSHRTLRVIGLFGAVIGGIGIAAFAWAYPQNWGRPRVDDHTVTVLATYVLGLVLLVAATFASLVADFVLRMQVRSKLRGELGRDPTDEEIQRDIDEAWRRHKVTWGGTVADTGRGIKVKVEDLPADWAALPRIGREVYAGGERATAVDTAVDQLTNFRGGRQRKSELPEAGLGDSAGALKALRTARAEAPKPSFWDRLLRRAPKAPPGFDLQGAGPRPPL